MYNGAARGRLRKLSRVPEVSSQGGWTEVTPRTCLWTRYGWHVSGGQRSGMQPSMGGEGDAEERVRGGNCSQLRGWKGWD
jgi:hypothetical protein